jgi:tricorn protease
MPVLASAQSSTPQAADKTAAAGQSVNARMFRYPAVSSNQIAFVYAGDIWIAPKEGGTALRLSSPRGEELFPRFSPDGSTIAFSGNYDGNTDVYTVAANGGLPRRITHHGAADLVLGWHPNGKEILFATSMTSYKDRFNQLYLVSGQGGLPKKLPAPYGEFGAISPDGKILAYVPISVDFRTWKRYRGGMNPDIWFYDLEKNVWKNVTENDANDSFPMWHGDTLYFLSDRDVNKRDNIWAYDVKKNHFRQITTFETFDVHFPSIGPNNLIFENAGHLYLLDLPSEKYHEVEVRIVSDRATLKPHAENVSGLIHDHEISPSGKRAVFQARGDIFTVPVEYGVVRNITRTSGVAERWPTWSPDGKSIAYFSDRNGEYELTIKNAEGTGDETVLTKLGEGFRYKPHWSPDSRKIVFIDQAMKIWLHDLDKKETKQIDHQLWLYHGALQSFRFNWSADSRWIAYPGDLENRQSAIVLFDTKDMERNQVTSGFYDDDAPTFDPEGKYLFFRSSRTFNPDYSDLDNSWIYANTHNLVAVPLRKDVPSPLAPRNDDEGDKDKKDKAKSDEEKKDADKPKKDKDDKDGQPSEKTEAAKTDEKKSDDKSAEKKDDKKEKPPKPVEVDLDDFERRVVILPPKPGRYADLHAVSGKLVFRRLPRTGSGEEKSPVLFYDLEKREEKTIVDDSDIALPAAKSEKLLVAKKGAYSIVDIKEGQKMDKKLATSGLEATVDPQAEWKQLFSDTWRFQRDYFYDPGMHGVEWKVMRGRYGALIDDAMTRWDVSYVLGELIGELNSSHTYRTGGSTERVESRSVGYLGCDFALENGAYRIKKIIDGAAWDAEVRSPLRQPGIQVREGDYLLAVNGEDIDPQEDPWAAFQGMGDKSVFLTINERPTKEGSRQVLVQTLSSEARLRNLAWIEENRLRVDKASDGKLGYVYVPDTGRGGQDELVRQFRGQEAKAGLIIDERFNSGGQIPDRFVELLNRPLMNYWGVRDGADWKWPPVSNQGPKAMLINGWSGSGGDCFPYYFHKMGLGPLIGTRTWGGLIGITGAPPLIDGGGITVPTFGIYDPKSDWIIEGHGVDPDIKVIDDPVLMAKGEDPQLDRAVAEVLKALQANPQPEIKKPKYPNRGGK